MGSVVRSREECVGHNTIIPILQRSEGGPGQPSTDSRASKECGAEISIRSAHKKPIWPLESSPTQTGERLFELRNAGQSSQIELFTHNGYYVLCMQMFSTTILMWLRLRIAPAPEHLMRPGPGPGDESYAYSSLSSWPGPSREKWSM